MLGSSERPLCLAHDLAMLDLDGVVYIGGAAVPGAPRHLATARRHGQRLAFITNNASRTPAQVAANLAGMDVPADAADVVTSAQAAARVLVERCGAGARIALLGAEGLARALEEQGLVPVGVEDDADALVTGYGPEVRWREVMRAAVRIRDGLWWVASNTDLSFPAAFGTAPGHGVLVETLSRFSGVQPVVAGKPQRPLLDETVRRTGAERPLMVGDRLDTDIAGAVGAGMPSLLVLTGVTGLAELVSAGIHERPTYLAPDLGGLLEPHPEVCADAETVSVGGWRVRVTGGRLEATGSGASADWWRAVAVAGWRHLDLVGRPADPAGLTVPGA